MKYKIIVDKQSRINPSKDKKEYIIDIEELRCKGEIYDSLIITKDEDYVMRRLSLSEYQVLKVLDKPIKEPIPSLNIELFEGDNYIYLLDMSGNRLYAEYLIKNDFNDTFITRSEATSAINQTAQQIELTVNQKLTGYSTTEEMNSAINMKADSITSEVNKKLESYDTSEEVNSKIDQKADSITSSVSKTYATKGELNTAKTEIKQTTDSITSTVSKKVGNDEVISKINQSAEKVGINSNKIQLSANDILNLLAGNTINLTSKNIVISSDKFSVDKNGNITATGGKIGGFELGASQFKANTSFSANYTSADSERVKNIITGSIKPTSADYGKYDLTQDKQIDILDWFWINRLIAGTNTVNGQFILNTTDSRKCVQLIDSNKEIRGSIGTFGSFFHTLSCASFHCNGLISAEQLTVDGIYAGVSNIDGVDTYCIQIENNKKIPTISLEGRNGHISCTSLEQTSLKSKKKNIKGVNIDAIGLIKNADICSYNLKSEKKGTKKHIGLVIGEGYNCPTEVISENGQGVEQYSMTSVAWKAIQELIKKDEDKDKQIAELTQRLEKLEAIINEKN